jgi:hypothetical protein
MLKKILGFGLLVSSSAWAGGVLFTPTTITSPNKDTQTRAYAGLVWVFNNKASMKPDLTLGVQSLRVKSSDSVSGADLNLRFKIEDGLKLDSNRLSYVGGERNAQGQLGFGYSYTHKSWLTTGAVSGPFSKAGTDYVYGKKVFEPFIEVNTIKKPKKVNEGSPGCLNNSTNQVTPGNCPPPPV